MKKVVLVLLICCTAIAMSWTGISMYSEAKAEDRVLEAFIATPFYNDGEVRRTREPDFEKTHPGLYAVTDGGDYLYWMKENGTLAYITAVDANHQTYSEEVLPDYHKEDAALAAEEWFDKAFFEEEKVFGNRKKIHAEDFNGARRLQSSLRKERLIWMKTVHLKKRISHTTGIGSGYWRQN